MPRSPRHHLLSFALGAGLASLAAAQPATRALASPASREAVASGLIVQMRGAPAHETAQALAARPAAQAALQRLAALGGRTLQGARPTGRDAWVLDFGRLLSAGEAQALAERLASDPGVAWAVPNSHEHRLDTLVTAPVPPLDPRYASGEQWWLEDPSVAAHSRGVPDFLGAWPVTTGVPGAVVAVLDTGYTDHSQLAGRLLAGYDFVSEVPYANDGDGRDADAHDPGDWVTSGEAATATFAGCEVQDSSWHGTNIAGLIGATTNEQPLALDVASIDWNARILPVRVAGKCGATVSDIIDGMRWAAGLHVAGVPDNPTPARIINISFGGSAACGPYQAAIDEVAAAGAVVVAAAGNTQGALERPASCHGVVAVGAVNRDGFKAAYSAFGSGITLMAPGGDPDDPGAPVAPGDSGLLTIDNAGTTTVGSERTAYLFGTSFAAPLASGTVALMLSAHPGLSAAEVIAGLRASVRPHVTSPALPTCSGADSGRCLCTAATCGAGLLDAAQAVRWTPPAGGGGSGGGGGGGALGPLWLLGLAWAIRALRRH